MLPKQYGQNIIIKKGKYSAEIRKFFWFFYTKLSEITSSGTVKGRGVIVET